jgi:hypothetical protein
MKEAPPSIVGYYVTWYAVAPSGVTDNKQLGKHYFGRGELRKANDFQRTMAGLGYHAFRCKIYAHERSRDLIVITGGQLDNRT